MEKITHIIGRELLDSRGFPALEVEVRTSHGMGRALVPSGASCGQYEAWELRDGDPLRFLGKGLRLALNGLRHVIAPALVGHRVVEQAAIDRLLIELDGTDNKRKLGANTLLGVSLAVAQAAAACAEVPLFVHLAAHDNAHKEALMPVPMVNILNGGRHASNGMAVQEFMIMPIGADSFAEGLRMCSEIFHVLKKLLEEAGLSTGLGDEGGFAPALKSNEEAIEWIMRGCETAGYQLGEDIVLCLDVASSEFYNTQTKRYHIQEQDYTHYELIELLQQWVDKYPIFSIEDAMAENDWEGWQQLSKQLGQRVQLVGDDVFVTHPKRLGQGIAQQIANAILIKLNQIGTLSETLEVIAQAKRANYACVISHRSGETEDHIIADLAVACQSGQIKAGSVARGERTAKYNQLLRIEEYFGNKATYAGVALRKTLSVYEK